MAVNILWLKMTIVAMIKNDSNISDRLHLSAKFFLFISVIGISAKSHIGASLISSGCIMRVENVEMCSVFTLCLVFRYGTARKQIYSTYLLKRVPHKIFCEARRITCI